MEKPSEMNMAPDPSGISGCGLWYVPSYFESIPRFFLTGIMIEHHKEKNAMVATKAGFVLALAELM